MNAPASLDPWIVERARRPAAKLLRVIDLERDEQRFDVLKPMAEGLDYELDGCTLIIPAGINRTPSETAELIRLHDEQWREREASVAGISATSRKDDGCL